MHINFELGKEVTLYLDFVQHVSTLLASFVKF